MDQTSLPATTYQQTSGRYPAAADARRRFEELVTRDVSARTATSLRARDDYRYAHIVDPEPLTVTEHLELLAAAELLARYYRHPAHAHRALQAGATGRQVAAATRRDEADARRDYRRWADEEHQLWADYNGELGMDAADYAAASARADAS